MAMHQRFILISSQTYQFQRNFSLENNFRWKVKGNQLLLVLGSASE